MALFKKRLLLAGGVVLGISFSAPIPLAWPQEKYPVRPIELVVAFPAGGFADISGRIFSEEMSKLLNVPITPVNKAGASGSLAATSMLKSPKDGYTLLVNTLGGMVLAPATLKDVAYDTNRDFYPVALITSAPDGVTVRAESPLKTIHDLIEAAKKSPGKLSYGSAGTGTGGHFNGGIFATSAGIKIKHVPFKGGGEYIPALLGGHIDFVIGTAIPILPHENAGRTRTLTLLGRNRMGAFPKASPSSELGVKGDFLDSWAGCFVAAGTPKPIVDILVAAAEKVIKSREFSARIEKTGGIVQYVPPVEFQSMIERDKNTVVEMAKKEGL